MAHQCVYFEDREARSQVLHPLELRSPAAYSDLARAGFRRTGDDLYRPRCQSCEACIPTRVAVERFRWGRRFRRVLKRNADLVVRAEPATPDRCPASNSTPCTPATSAAVTRTARCTPRRPRNWSPCSGPEWAATFLLNVRLDGRLVASAVTDTLDDGLAAVYTFFDPDLAGRSLGVFSILQQVEECRRRDLPYLYLGFWIADSRQDALQDRVPARSVADRRPVARDPSRGTDGERCLSPPAGAIGS